MSDGEGAIGKLVPFLNSLGIEVDISGAGGHVSKIERRIQVIKERVRAHMTGKLPFTLTIIGVSTLILFCVSRINFQFSGTRMGGPSPREIFSGRRVSGTLDFRVGFGDYVQATTANTDSRTDDCIVMLPTGNCTGSVKMLSLATGRIVTRDQFRVLPMPLSAINRLNELALKDGRKLTIRTDNDYAAPPHAAEPNQPAHQPFLPPMIKDPIMQMNRDQLAQDMQAIIHPAQQPNLADNYGLEDFHVLPAEGVVPLGDTFVARR